MIRLKINEIHIKFSDWYTGALWGALLFFKRLMSLLSSSCEVLSKIWNIESIYRNKVLLWKLTCFRWSFSRVTFVCNVSFCDGYWKDIFENNISAEERVYIDLTWIKVSEKNNILILENVNWSYQKLRQHSFDPS